jgi:hypothetical protein
MLASGDGFRPSHPLGTILRCAAPFKKRRARRSVWDDPRELTELAIAPADSCFFQNVAAAGPTTAVKGRLGAARCMGPLSRR